MFFSRQAVAGKTSLFFHIPKTGGTTVARNLARYYPADRRILNKRIRNFLADNAFRIELDTGHFISSHMNYDFYQRICGPHISLAVFRDPVMRLISTYYYLKASPIDDRERVPIRLAKCLTLKEWLEAALSEEHYRKFLGVSNGYYRILRGRASTIGHSPDRSQDYRADLDIVFERMDGFTCIGITEQMDRSIANFCACLEVPPPKKVLSFNKASDLPPWRRQHREPIDDETEDLLAKLTFLDRHIYQFALAKFEKHNS